MQRYITDERMYEAGLLRIALRMRRNHSISFDDLFAETVTELRLDPVGFRTYVNVHMHSLVAQTKTSKHKK